MPSQTAPPSDLDRLAREMITVLDRIVYHLMTAVIAEAKDEEISLTFGEIRVFKTVSAQEPIAMNTLAGLMRISLPTASRLVDSLVEKGVLVRTRTAEDRRLVLVSRSEMSKARERRVFADRAAMIRGTLKQLAPAERKKMANALSQIAVVLQFNPAAQAARAEAKEPAVAGKRVKGVEDAAVKGNTGQRKSR